jgi:hypothetical protein
LRQRDSQLPAGPVPAALPGLYGHDRIVAGARFLSHLDPGWWREGALLPANLTMLDMADPYRCVLAWWAARHLPAPLRGARQVPPYDRATLALCLSSRQAQTLGFTGADADLLTSGWRHLITYLRAQRNTSEHRRVSRAAGTSAAEERRLTVDTSIKSEASPRLLPANGRRAAHRLVSSAPSSMART